MIEVLTLNDVEMKLAYMIGEYRHLTKANEKRVGSPLTSRQDEVIGSQGEIAFAKRMGIYPNVGIAVEPGSPDYTIAGVTVDVKSTKDKHGDHNLVVPMHKAQKGRCDLYVLVSVSHNVCTFGGFVPGRVVFASQVKNLGWGDCYYVERRNLQPIGQIMIAAAQLAMLRDQMSKVPH